MRRSTYAPEPDCAVAQSLGVIGDGWELLIVRDLARGVNRFDQLAESLRISRKVLTERLTSLIEHELVERTAYQHRPTRHAYRLTPKGRALLPVLVALQGWGDRWLLGDGGLTGTNDEQDPASRRVHELPGQLVPDLRLLSTSGEPRTVVDPAARATVVFAYPATGQPSPLPDGWAAIPGASGCTLENRLFGHRYEQFRKTRIAVHGVSTQRPDEQRDFATAEEIPQPLLSDVELELAAALRLPTFRVGGYERLKRMILVASPDRVIRAVRYPVTDLEAAVDWALATA